MKGRRIQRLLKLITRLQARSHSCDELARELKVSTRTLYRDFDMLRLAGVPINYDSANRCHAIDQGFFLPPVNFTVPEVLALMMLVQKYHSRAMLPNFQDAGSAVLKLESAVPKQLLNYCGSALEKLAFHHPPVTDISPSTYIFGQLWQAAQKQLTTQICYDPPAEQPEINTLLDPYRVVFIGRGWYVIGFSHLHHETRTFKIDRVIEAKITEQLFKVDPQFDPDRYFGKAWRMIRGDRTFHVIVRFSPKVATNVEEVLWHSTQQTQRLSDSSLRFEVDVDGIDEISWWILGYGKEAVVEAPLELRLLIHQHIREMAALYEQTSKEM